VRFIFNKRDLFIGANIFGILIIALAFNNCGQNFESTSSTLQNNPSLIQNVKVLTQEANNRLNIRIQNITKSSAQLSWTRPGGITGFSFLLTSGIEGVHGYNEPTTSAGQVVEVTSIDVNTSSKNLNGLVAGRTYRIDLLALYNGYHERTIVHFTTAPSNSQIGSYPSTTTPSVSGSSIADAKIRWPNAQGQRGALKISESFDNQNYNLVKTIPMNSSTSETPLNQVGLRADTSSIKLYTLTHKPGYQSVVSDVVDFDLSRLCTNCDDFSVTNFRATAVNKRSFSASWTLNQNADGYFYSLNGGPQGKTSFFSSSITIRHLEADKDYTLTLTPFLNERVTSNGSGSTRTVQTRLPDSSKTIQVKTTTTNVASHIGCPTPVTLQNSQKSGAVTFLTWRLGNSVSNDELENIKNVFMYVKYLPQNEEQIILASPLQSSFSKEIPFLNRFNLDEHPYLRNNEKAEVKLSIECFNRKRNWSDSIVIESEPKGIIPLAQNNQQFQDQVPQQQQQVSSNSNCVDTGVIGDGWGWDNDAQESCRIGATIPATNQNQNQQLINGTPAFQKSDSDPDGDGYGWENNATCIVR